MAFPFTPLRTSAFICFSYNSLYCPMAASHVLEDIRNAQRAQGPATILAIGTANPSFCVMQTDFPDGYFRVTDSDHMTDLKHKFKRICEATTIKKRYLTLNEEILKQNKSLVAFWEPSLNVRQDIAVEEVPKLGKEAAEKAIKEWGQPKSKITHLIFCTYSGMDMPGADYQLTKLLGLSPTVKRFMLYLNGCFAGGTVLRLAKDLAENNKGARVLAVCSEITAIAFRGPSETRLDSLVGQALFGDGAGAVIVGSSPDASVERPLFQLMSAAQTLIPDCAGDLGGDVREEGMILRLSMDVPRLVSSNVEKSLVEAFSPLGITDWNSIFYIVHPGGPPIIDQIEAELSLKPEKLEVTRHVLREYGNMSSASVMFVMDEMRKKSVEEGKATTGEGLEWGVLLGFGPGITIETLVLHSVPLEATTN